MQPNQYKIVVVDNDARSRSILERYLSDENFIVRNASNAEQMERLLARENFHAVILTSDDSVTICNRLRMNENFIPIIIVSSKNDEEERIMGLNTGADDYLSQPFNLRELLARLNAILRRQRVEIPAAPMIDETIVTFGDFTFNLGTREMFKGDTYMPLTSGEFSVLKILVTHPRQPMSRDKLMNLARGREYSAMERSIDVQISRLRRMLETDINNPRYIQTVWGVGYVFVPDDSSTKKKKRSLTGYNAII